MGFDEWVLHGVNAGYCSLPVCGTHDGSPLSPEEQAMFEDGWDPCVPIVRLWPDNEAQP